jgi:hypothetical protein
MSESIFIEPADGIINNSQFCERYGCCSVTAWKLRNDKKNPLPHFHVGGQIRYRLSEVEKYFESKRSAASST